MQKYVDCQSVIACYYRNSRRAMVGQISLTRHDTTYQ
jgi:hypothetical protein